MVMDAILPIVIGVSCGVLALIGLRELLKELITASTGKAKAN